MADVLVGPTIEIALQKMLSFATDQIGMVVGFQEDLDRLRGTVGKILAVVDDAEAKQVDDQAVKRWLEDLEELAYRATHVFDKLNYEMLRRSVEDEIRLKCQVRFLTTIFHRRMAPKIRSINNEFRLISENANQFGLQFRVAIRANTALLPTNTGIFMNREKDSTVAPNVVGRENVAAKIVEKLLVPSTELLSFIPITGMGGIGKTTLAQFVYNNELIVKHFAKKIWVCVSENFEPKRIFKLILESLTMNHVVGPESRDTLVQRIKQEIQGARYLLVLDDVWCEDWGLWNDLLCSLAGISSTHGNWIIVTTRNLRVVSNLPAGDPFPLEKLSDEDSLCIVKEKACLRGEGIQEFEGIREKIVELCHGIPLAASVIGGLLHTNPREEWLSVLTKRISNVGGDEYSRHVQQILRLSFDHLPSPYLKKCFTYCSLFAKDSLLRKESLIELWMAEGFLQPMADNEMEIIGNQYINYLVQSSLLQEVIGEDFNPSGVRMHDLVHDLAQSISRSKIDARNVNGDDRFFVADSFGEETKTLPKQRIRMLWTLILECDVPDDMLMRFKHLHVLKLSHVEEEELPSSIGKLIHLRYLDLSGYGIRALPDSICKLYNLQTLRIDGCKNLRALPNGMTKLISLRHLYCHKDLVVPPKMGQLTNLRTLKFFRVNQAKGYQIMELGCLENLRGELSIFRLESVNSKKEALQAGLYRKPLNRLALWWSGDGENDEEVLDGLQPHPNLQELQINSFSGSQFPSWVMNMAVNMGQNLGLSKRLDKLERLSIWKCNRCKQLPALGQLPCLMHLSLSGLDNISCIEPSFYGIDDSGGSGIEIGSGQAPKKIFPALKCLWVADMKNLKEWMEPKTASGQAPDLFPNLEELFIVRCSQLTRAPAHFPSLKLLDIDGANLYHVLPIVEMDRNCSRYPPNSIHAPQECIPILLELLRIDRCENLRELPQYLYAFQSLRNLVIENCTSLTSLPIPSKQQRLTSLQMLRIDGCHGLTSLPCELLESCTSLQDLTINDCGGLTSLPCELLQSCTSLQKLTINNCDGLTSIPGELLNSCASLRYLRIFKLRNLESFQFDLRRTPSLSSLNLFHVPKLIAAQKIELVSYCSRLSNLRIGEFSDSVEFDWSVLSSLSLASLELNSWPNLVSLPDQLQHLTALRQLILFDLGQIEALPDWFANLVSLEELRLYDCEKLCYLPSVAAMRSLTKLRWLYIMRCPLLKERCSQRTDPNSEWAKISHISYTEIDHQRVVRDRSESKRSCLLICQN